ncbi:LysM peptidoglycan-binding domain-containing protein [Microbacterium sp. F1-18]
MNKREGILLGAAGLAVVGLFALAMPVISSLAGSVTTQTAANGGPTAPPSSSESPPSGAVAEISTPLDGQGGVAGYQDIDGGVSIRAKGPGDCPTWAMINPYDAWNSTARLGGTITDLGPTTYASGEVGLNDEGEISTYTVASGDTAYGIGDRLCIDYITVLAYNGKFMPAPEIQPGDILILRP